MTPDRYAGGTERESFNAANVRVMESLEKQLDTAHTVVVLWRHYFAENHPGDFKDCADPACAPFTHLIGASDAR